MRTLIEAFLLIFTAELGDKSMLLAMTFATRFPLPQVLIGIFLGILANHGIAVWVGSQAGRLLPVSLIHPLSGVLFLLFAFLSLRTGDEEEENEHASRHIWLACALTFFVGEFGDKTQITAMTLASTQPAPLVLAGTVSAMLCTSLLSIWIGTRIGKKIPERLMRVLSGLVFLVEDVHDPVTEILLDSARNMQAGVKVGDVIRKPVTPKDFGRISAQTARNIVIQKIKDAEREVVYNEFADREKEMITGTVQRYERNNVYINMGRTEGLLPLSEQVPGERVVANQRMKLFIQEVRNSPKGPQIVLSRANPGLVIRMFETEVPEISDGVVEIFSIAREAGSRTKIAVFSRDENVDPVGACVGFKGARVRAIVDELGGEKIDIIVWDKDIRTFIANALSPSKVTRVIVKEKEKTALVVVPDDQLSLAIGKEGQNAVLPPAPSRAPLH
jgi:N utilization substance protein A